MKLNRTLSTIAFICLAKISVAQLYDIALLRPNLLKNANMVVREEEKKITIVNDRKINVRYKNVYTILNANGDRFASFASGYSKTNSIDNLEGTLYDAKGVKIRSLKKSEVQDVSSTGGDLAGDYRVKSHDFNYTNYPYTVEYNWEETENQTKFLGGWQPQYTANISIESSIFSVAHPTDFTIRQHTINYTGKPTTTLQGNVETITWQLKNIEAIEYEYGMPRISNLTTGVYIAPNQFYTYGYAGDMSSWKTYGDFQNTLNKDRDLLPDNIKKKVHELVDNEADWAKKVAILYNYLQQNTHYISIQLGIGGWQPFPAEFVATKGYGDCKALSNYMVALLKEANIIGHYTIIRAGKYNNYFIPEFVMPQSNHIIVAVPKPNTKDTIWLECTSQTMPAGFLGDFTQDRYALLVKEDGGHLVHTPVYNEAKNIQKRQVKASIDAEGNLEATVKNAYEGLEYDSRQSLLANSNKQDINTTLQKEINLPQYVIEQFNYKEDKSYTPKIEETYLLKANSYAGVSGKRLFIVPNLLSKFNFTVDTTKERKYPLDIQFGYTEFDTLYIAIPSGYTVEAMPKPMNEKNEFGEYNISIQKNNNELVYVRKFQLKNGYFPREKYKSFGAFVNAVSKTDNGRVVLVKSE